MEETGRTEFRIRAISKGIGLEEMYILILKEHYGDMLFPIPLTQEEQEMFMAVMHEKRFTVRPLLDTFRNVMNHTGTILECATVTQVEKGEYTVSLEINAGGEAIQLDCPAPIGLLMALHNRAPIYIADKLLDQNFGHAGKDTFRLPIKALNTQFIQEALDDAVSNEQYELATLLRDELKRRS